MLTLYDDPISGNGYKVRLILRLTGKAFRVVNLDITSVLMLIKQFQLVTIH